MLKKEIKVPNFPGVYRVVAIDSSGVAKPTGFFRVRRRFVLKGRWTTKTSTVGSFDEAKRLAKTHFKPATETPTRETAISFEKAFLKFMHHKEVEKKLSIGTIKGYWARYEHLKFFAPMNVMEISAKTVDVWIDLLLHPDYLKQQQGSRICYDHEFTLLVCFFRYYRNFIDETFVVPILDRHRQRACARPKNSEAEIRFLNVDDERDFLTMLAKWPTIHDIAVFQLHTGARIGEAAALEFRNIDFSRNEIRIAQHLHWERHRDGKIICLPGTKTGPTRMVPLTAECRAMLLNRKRNSTSGTVFSASDDSWLAYRSIQAIYDRAFKRLNLPHRGTHIARHTFAVRFLDQTKDIYALQKLLGHTDLKVTQVYAKYSNESVRRSFQLFRGGLSDAETKDVPQLVPRGVS